MTPNRFEEKAKKHHTEGQHDGQNIEPMNGQTGVKSKVGGSKNSDKVTSFLLLHLVNLKLL